VSLLRRILSDPTVRRAVLALAAAVAAYLLGALAGLPPTP